LTKSEIASILIIEGKDFKTQKRKATIPLIRQSSRSGSVFTDNVGLVMKQTYEKVVINDGTPVTTEIMGMLLNETLQSFLARFRLDKIDFTNTHPKVETSIEGDMITTIVEVNETLQSFLARFRLDKVEV